MSENKVQTRLKGNGNIRSNESGMGLYSGLINQAKRNGVKNTPNTSYNNLPAERRKKWDDIINKDTEKEYPINASSSVEAADNFRIGFYNLNADQIKFTRLHRMVLEVLEEMYNQQSIDNTWNWKKGYNGDEYERQGCVYTNPTELARYMWGYANQKNVMEVINVLNELNSKNVYLSRMVKCGKQDVYTVLRVILIPTLGTSSVYMKDGKAKEVYSYVQLNSIFFEGITKNFFRHRNNFFSKVRDYYNKLRMESGNYKQKYKLPPEEPFNLLHYLSSFTVNKKYNLTLDEETIVNELNIKEFRNKTPARGRKKIEDAINATQAAGAIKKWNITIGKKGQMQYVLVLNPDYFESKGSYLLEK